MPVTTPASAAKAPIHPGNPTAVNIPAMEATHEGKSSNHELLRFALAAIEKCACAVYKQFSAMVLHSFKTALLALSSDMPPPHAGNGAPKNSRQSSSVFCSSVSAHIFQASLPHSFKMLPVCWSTEELNPESTGVE